MDTKDTEVFIREQLRAKGFRITTPRIKLLKLLYRAEKPLSIQRILGSWKEDLPNQTTLYRTLSDLADAHVVRRVDLNTGTAHFEYTPERPHHHHIICTDCGAVEDIEKCSVDKLHGQMTQASRRFKSIYSHNLEFFGLCASCPRA